jgi:hypothetical protein
VHDIRQGPASISGSPAEQVIADELCDSGAFISCIQSAAARALIPPRKRDVISASMIVSLATTPATQGLP